MGVFAVFLAHCVVGGPVPTIFGAQRWCRANTNHSLMHGVRVGSKLNSDHLRCTAFLSDHHRSYLVRGVAADGNAGNRWCTAALPMLVVVGSIPSILDELRRCLANADHFWYTASAFVQFGLSSVHGLFVVPIQTIPRARRLCQRNSDHVGWTGRPLATYGPPWPSG